MPPENYWYSSSDGTYKYEFTPGGGYRRLNAKEQVYQLRLDRLLLALSYIYDYIPSKPKND